jgi:cytochrome d ubiquinol oxidase subunit I
LDTLLAARAQMEVSLAFHMIFAALGIGMPLLMLIAERRWLQTGREHYRVLARTWGKATALTFAVGAVSGTALSFELGLLWPRFMAEAGGIIGPAFALEGYAFFIEAIFLGLYLYGWDRLTPRAHWWAGVPVAVSGMLSGVLVVAANAWMQAPVFPDDAWAAFAPFRSPRWLDLALHSALSAYIATGFAVAGVYALGLLRGRDDAYHRTAIRIALGTATVAALLQPVSGDISARMAAAHQPAKLAAMEALYVTRTHAPLTIGGIPDDDAQATRWGIEIPAGLSLLVGHDPAHEVTGLDAFDRAEWPNVLIVHTAFQVMVAAGLALIAIGALYWLSQWRRAGREPRALWMLLVAASPLGYLALQAGWLVTEVGRQPWVIYEVMRTADAVTTVHGVPITFFGFSLLYLLLGIALAVLLRALATHNTARAALHTEAEVRT